MVVYVVNKCLLPSFQVEICFHSNKQNEYWCQTESELCCENPIM